MSHLARLSVVQIKNNDILIRAQKSWYFVHQLIFYLHSMLLAGIHIFIYMCTNCFWKSSYRRNRGIMKFRFLLWLNSCAHSFPLNVLKYFSQDLLFSNRAQEYVLEITLLRVLKIRKISMAARRLSRLFDRVGNRKCDRDSEYNLIWIVIVWKAAGGIRIFASIISIQNND